LPRANCFATQQFLFRAHHFFSFGNR